MVVGNPVAADHCAVAPQVFDLYMAPLTAADTLCISDVHHFWGSFWPSNLADQMRLMLGQSSI